MKFSIIIPVYNVQDYLKRCLDSTINQTYKNFEVIVINDGSTDDSESIISSYKNIKYYKKKNGGLSSARNEGVKKATGDYILFLDSDDYINSDLLKVLNDHLNNYGDDIVRFQISEMKNDESIDLHEKTFNHLTSTDASKILYNYKYVEPAWAYCYKTSFYKKNNFKYKEGYTHEDFGLTPLIISKAKYISSIDYIGYNYCIRSNSIMTSSSYDKIIKKVHDFYEQGLVLLRIIKDKTALSYIANCMIEKTTELNKKEYKEYLNKIKKDKIISYILTDSISRKAKKIVISINPKLYFKGGK